MPEPQAANFSRPLEILRDYHARLLEQLATLEALTTAPDTAALQALDRFFTVADRIHHEDEDLDLFPELNRVPLRPADLVHRLREQHRSAESAWRALSSRLRSAVSAGEIDPELIAQCNAYLELQRRHVRQEEEELLAQAEDLLSAKQQEKIGRAMAKRRGAAF